MRTSIAVAIAAGLLITACSSAGGSGPAASAPVHAPASGASPSASPGRGVDPTELTIFGAASLRRVLDEVKRVYEAGHPGTALTISTDSSVALETQIEQGAPADVFLSADTANPRKLVDGGFASGDAVPFAGNGLTVIVPAGNPGGITSPLDLAKPGLKVIAAGDEVPVTKYATQLVKNLAGLTGVPAGFEAAYAANVASKEDNVSAIVGKIELGEGDAGIVYVTDAANSEIVETIDIPDEANVPATYSGLVVKASSRQEASAAFLDWLAGADGRAILSSFGFLPPPS